MKIEFLTEPAGIISLKATPTDFDGWPPVQSLMIKWNYHGTSTDRITAAAALAFAPWYAGAFHLPFPFSALTAQRTQRWALSTQGVWVGPTPVRAGGLHIPKGSRHATLDTHNDQDLAIGFTSFHEATVNEIQAINIASNVEYLMAPNDPTSSLLSKLATVVLLAEDLEISTIAANQLWEINPSLHTQTASLLEAVGLGLTHA